MSASPHASWPLGTPFLCQPGREPWPKCLQPGGGHNRKNREADVLAVLPVHAGQTRSRMCQLEENIYSCLVSFSICHNHIRAVYTGHVQFMKIDHFFVPPLNGVNVCLKVWCMWWNDTWIGGWITVWNRYLFIAQMAFLFIISFFHWHPWLKFRWKHDFEIIYFHIIF